MGRLFEYFINYMSKEWPLVAQHSEEIDANGNYTIENTYLIYTPKIIKFVYYLAPSPPPFVSNTLPTTLCLADSKESKSPKTKINIVSRGIIKITTDPNKSQQSSKRQSAPEKKTGLRVHTVSSKSRSSEVQGLSQGPFLTCGWCADPNQELESFLPFPSRMQMRTVESRLIEDARPKKQQKCFNQDLFVIQKEERIQLDEQITHRKKIFEKTNKVNKSLHNLSAQGRSYSFSRFRKSIFQPYQIRSKIFSLDTSFRRKSKIFGSSSLRTNLKQSHYDSLKTIQIPPCILKSWEQQQRTVTFALPKPETTR